MDTTMISPASSQSVWRRPGLPVIIALALLVVVAAVFLLEVFTFDNTRDDEVPATLTADTYMERVNGLLANANPDNGEVLLTEYDCVVCHVTGAEGGVAPLLDGVGARAAERRPPLTAAAYLYESIMHPAVFVVEGYVPAMPANYPERLSDAELGDLIAYLLLR